MALLDATRDGAVSLAERGLERLSEAARPRRGSSAVPILIGSVLIGVALARVIKATSRRQEAL